MIEIGTAALALLLLLLLIIIIIILDNCIYKHEGSFSQDFDLLVVQNWYLEVAEVGPGTLERDFLGNQW